MVRSFDTSTTDGQGGGDVRLLDASESSGIVIDADFLFSADFIELGDDLLLRGPDGQEILLRDYFVQDPPPPLETAEGAQLLPETVDALAVPDAAGFVQAGGVQPAEAIGEVREIDGIARVQRTDGTRENLNEGDPIFQGDVVSTGVGSELGIVFVDDTVFSLSAGSRMVIDELVYDPASSANSMGISLIQGTFVFVTGKVAPSGGIDVETPVGTIGIRGTTVGVQIATFGGTTRITNLQNPETGELGSFTFSNGAGSALFSLANHFLDVRSASADPGAPSVVSGQSVVDAFGRALNRAVEIQRNLSQFRRDDDSDQESLLDQESQLEAEQLQALEEAGLTPEQIEALLSEPPIETAAGPAEDQPLGEGSSFAAGLSPDGLGDDTALGGDGGIETTSAPPSPSDGDLDNFISSPDGGGSDNSEEILLFGNSPPEVNGPGTTVGEGDLVPIGPDALSAFDAETSDPALLVYTVTAVNNGLVLLAVGDGFEVVFSFTQADVENGLVFFAHDGSEDPLASFTVTVADPDGNVSAPETVPIQVEIENDAPVLENNNLNLQEGGSVVLSSENLSASDPDSSDEELVFTVSDVTGGQFQLLGEDGFASDSAVAQQVAVTSFTQQQIIDGQVVFVHDGGGAPPSYLVSVSDGQAESAPEAVVVSFESVAGSPAVDLAVQTEDGCVKEDTPTDLQISAETTTPGDSLTTVVVAAPAGWVLTASVGGQIAGVSGDGSATLTLTLVEGVESFSGLITATPPENSDLDAGFTVTATAVDGDDATVGEGGFEVPVDAVADGPSVSITVNDSGDADAEFAPFETGSVSVQANFGDVDDGSESHTVVVEIPEGFIVGLLTGLPDGVDAEVDSDGNVVFTLATGVAGFDYSFDVTAPEEISDGEAFVFSAVARAEETPSDEECDPEDNLATAEASAEATSGAVGVPTVDLAVQTDDGCVKEDTPTDLQVSAETTTPGDSLTTVVVTAPAGWALTASLGGQIAGVNGDGSATLTLTLVEGVESFSGLITATPLADSDTDAGFTVTATAVDGSDSAVGESSFDVPVDAVADGPAVSISVNDSDDADAEFAPFETGSVNVTASFGDVDDGSETHTVVVEIPEGFIVGLLTGLPDGVSAEVDGDGNVGFTVATGVAGFDYSFDVTAPEEVGDGQVLVFSAEARAEETPSDEECDPEDNLATAEASAEATGGAVGVPTVDLTVQTDDGCVKEDTPTDLQVSAETTTPGDSLTTVMVSAPAGWILTASLGGQVAGVSGDGTSTLTLTLVDGVESFSGLVTATPPEDSDLDAGFTVTATAVDGSDAAMGEGGFDVPVDAVADGGAGVATGGIAFSVDGSAVDLDLSLTLRDGNAENPAGDAFNGGGFDDDSSEAVTTIEVALSGDPAIVDEGDASLLFSPDFGGTVEHSEGSLVWTFSGSEAALQELVTTFQVDPGEGYVGTLTATLAVTTEEIAVEGADCDPGDDAVTETFAFDVEVVESLQGDAVINEVGLGASEAQAAEFDSGVFSVDAGLSYIEIRNSGDVGTELSGQAVEQLDVEIAGPDGTKVTLDLATLSGAPEDHGLVAGESLVLFEDGTWAIYDAAGAVRDAESFGSFDAGAPWGLGESTSDALAVNLIQEVVPDGFAHVDGLLANDADTSGLSHAEDEIWIGAGKGSAAAASLLGGFANNGQFNGQLGDQWAVLGSILTAGQKVLNDPESLNQAVNDGVDDVTRVFARVYADAVPGQAAIPGDGGLEIDSDQALDWTTSNQSSQGAVNQAAEDFNPQDELDDLDPAQGAGSNDAIAGQTVVDVSEGGAEDAANGNESADDVLAGGRGQDFLYGDGDDNLLSGGDHNDLLFGDQGDDRLEGERGADLLADVDGRDTLIGGAGDDILIGGAERLTEGFVVSDGAGDLMVGDDVVDQAFPEGNIVSLLNDSALGGDVPSINVVYMIDTSGSMRRGLDGENDPGDGESRLDFAVQALLTVNQLLIDAGLAEFVNLKVIPFDNGPDVETVESESAEFDRADDAGLQPFLDGLRAVGSTNYEVALEVAANWLREDLDPGDAVSERHEDGQNFILFFSEGGDTYEPSPSLFEDLYDNGSGSPNISDLTIEAFGFGVSDDEPEALNALGKVVTGADGNGDQVSVVNAAVDFDALFTGDPDLGEDVILAGGGGDLIFGDTLIVDPDFDGSEADFAARLFSEEDGAFLRLPMELTGRADWIEGGAGNDSIMGQGGDDTIFGEAGADIIFGGAGDDLLDGGEGGDLLSGGAGADTFVLRAADAAGTLAGADVIQDFEDGVDSLGLADGLVLGDLQIADSADGAVITLQASGAFVALLSGVSAADIGPTDFTPVV